MDNTLQPLSLSELVANCNKMSPQASTPEKPYDYRVYSEAVADILVAMMRDMDLLKDENQQLKNYIKEQVDILAEFVARIDKVEVLNIALQSQIDLLKAYGYHGSLDMAPLPLFDGTFNAEICREFVATMQQYFEALETGGKELTEEEKVELIVGQLRGPAMRYWAARTSVQWFVNPYTEYFTC